VASLRADQPKIAPPTVFQPAGSIPDEAAADGTSWLIDTYRSTGDMYYVTKSMVLKGFIYQKKTDTVIPFGACKWVNGYNVWISAPNREGRIANAVFLNLETYDPDDKATLDRVFDEYALPGDRLAKRFPVDGTAAEKEAAYKKLELARLKEMEQTLEYVKTHARMFIRSNGTGDQIIRGENRDLIPDKGYYNALLYKWSRRDDAIIVYRLRGPANDPQWVVYKKVKGDGSYP
jgi:hypothetical protein